MECPGSYEATKDLPSSGTVYSREGTFGHEMAAICLQKSIPAKNLIGTVSTSGEFVFDEKLADAVQVYLDVINGLLLVQGGKLFVEKKVVLTKHVYGTLDAGILADNRRHVDIVDLKLGSGTYVAAEDNSQLLIYTLGLLKEFGIDPLTLDDATLHIVQPLYASDAPHRPFTVSGLDLVAFQLRLDAAEKAALTPGAPRIAGSHCRYCQARDTCPALREQALMAAQEVFPQLDPALPAVPPLIEMVPTERLAKVLAGTSIMEQWIKAVREEAFRRAAKGEKIPGYKLVAKVGHRAWVNEAEAAAVLTSFGIDPFEHSLLSPAKAEKAAPAAKKRIAGMTVKPDKGASLVPETDRRAELPFDPAAHFTVLPALEDDES